MIEFGTLMATLIGGFALFAVLFVRLEGKVDRLEQRLDGKVDRLEQRIGGLDGRVTGLDARMTGLELKISEQFQQLRRDLAEDLAAQRAEAARNLTAVTNAILAARGGQGD